jgi:hypothetical protein
MNDEIEILGVMDEDFLSSLIGKSKIEAQNMCDDNGYRMRIIIEDEKTFPMTMEFMFDRANVKIIDGIIVNAKIG